MLSSNKFVLGAVGCTAAICAYIFWKPRKRRCKPNGKNKTLCAGLQNVGNSCFVNAVLQAFAACPTISQWLRRFLTDHDMDTSQYLANTLLNIITGVNHEDGNDFHDTLSAAKLLSDLRRRRWMISADEQDSHEFFHVVMETLDEETSRYPTVISLFDTKTLESPGNKYQPAETAHTRTHTLLPILPHQSCSDNPFRGLLAGQLKCTQCAHQYPVKYESFDSLSLPIPASTWGSVRLQDLLTNFIQSERVSDVECPGCAKLQGCTDRAPRTTFVKKTSIAKLPQCLCIHIQRTIWLDDGRPTKRFNRVIFPETLSLDDYAYVKPARGRAIGLCGGNVARPTSLRFRSRLTLHPTDLSPPMTLLRALNFQSQSPSNGFLLQSPSTVAMTTPSRFTDINQNTPNMPIVDSLTVPIMNNLSVPQTSAYSYRLTASVCHIGDISSGHFVTFRRAPCQTGQISDQWIYTSDIDVHSVSALDVHGGTDVYMLFYERL